MSAAAANLAVLTQAERAVAELCLKGMTSPQIASRLGLLRTVVESRMRTARRKLGGPLRGPGRPPNDNDWLDASDDETPREMRARVAAEVAAGQRCGRCHLTLPCGGHDYQVMRDYHDPREGGA